MDKKRIYSFLVLVAVAGLLVGCGQNSEPIVQLRIDDKSYSIYEITSIDVPVDIFSINKSDETTVVLGLDKDGMLCRYLWANDGFGWFESVASDVISQDIAVRKADYDKDGEIAAYCESVAGSEDNGKYIYKEANDSLYTIDVSDVLKLRCSDTDESVYIYSGENVCKYDEENVDAYTCTYTIEISNVIDLCVRNNELIILTDKGISHYDSETGELKVTDAEIVNILGAQISKELVRESQDQSNDCKIMHMADNGAIYLALDDGLYCYKADEKKLIHFVNSDSAKENGELNIYDYIVSKEADEDEDFVLIGSGDNGNVMLGFEQ